MYVCYINMAGVLLVALQWILVQGYMYVCYINMSGVFLVAV